MLQSAAVSQVGSLALYFFVDLVHGRNMRSCPEPLIVYSFYS
jgi:hypothetical protein